MEFKALNEKSEKHMTPKSQVSILAKRVSYGVSSDSPFRTLPNASTPPSRFAKIINPFEQHLIERLHLPTFSPTVFAQNSTPKADQKFKWTIDDISSLKPADIDETTVSQHVCTMDNPEVDSLVQKKIETFFSEKEIVPSPMHVKTNHYVPLMKDCSSWDKSPSSKASTPKTPKPMTCEGSTQTVLTLPPVLPKELEEALKPYFNYHEEDQEYNEDHMENNSLYKQLFEFEQNTPERDSKTDPSDQDVQSVISSPALSTSLSPIQFSPFARGLESPFDMPELRECNLSPITKTPPKRLSRSRLDFSSNEKMSVDASLIVPDIENQAMTSKSFVDEEQGFSPLRHNNTTNPDMTVNWSMEYKQVSLASPCSSTDSDKMDVSNSNTPHSKLFIGKGQRKRLSDSFKSADLEANDNNTLQCEDVGIKNRFKLFKNDLTDAGYQSQETADFSNHSTNVFASTPSKRNLVQN
ncbi:protein aurora borealis [Anthonomus grandis grandis]|uniref:protein aurora borealis n=1 Tax=Anthonomus grandis grandis TaxID=2921223 RepID=UPI0021657636|nr:protein aurora borealis [Anthonomus grandis grandis]